MDEAVANDGTLAADDNEGTPLEEPARPADQDGDEAEAGADTYANTEPEHQPQREEEEEGERDHEQDHGYSEDEGKFDEEEDNDPEGKPENDHAQISSGKSANGSGTTNPAVLKEYNEIKSRIPGLQKLIDEKKSSKKVKKSSKKQDDGKQKSSQPHSKKQIDSNQDDSKQKSLQPYLDLRVPNSLIVTQTPKSSGQQIEPRYTAKIVQDPYSTESDKNKQAQKQAPKRVDSTTSHSNVTNSKLKDDASRAHFCQLPSVYGKSDTKQAAPSGKNERKPSTTEA